MPGRHVTDQQMRFFMKLRQNHPVETAAAKADISRATGYRIAQDPRLPSQKAQPRRRRRPDPLETIFEAEVVPLLKEAPGLRPVAIFDEMLRRHPELSPGTRRTLERRILAWRAEHGAEMASEIEARREALGAALASLDAITDARELSDEVVKLLRARHDSRANQLPGTLALDRYDVSTDGPN